jgi:hypothetical protein
VRADRGPGFWRALRRVQVLPPIPQQGVNFTGDYRIDVLWDFNTDPAFPNETVRSDCCTTAVSCPATLRRRHHHSRQLFRFSAVRGRGPAVCGDPGIGGRDNNFESFIVARSTAVPEPATLMLLGSGLTLPGSLFAFGDHRADIRALDRF